MRREHLRGPAILDSPDPGTVATGEDRAGAGVPAGVPVRRARDSAVAGVLAGVPVRRARDSAVAWGEGRLSCSHIGWSHEVSNRRPCSVGFSKRHLDQVFFVYSVA